MNKQKLIVFTACLLLASCVLSACGATKKESFSDEDTDSASASSATATTKVTTTAKKAPVLSNTTTKPEPEPADMPHDERLLLGGVNITSYRIVYGSSPLNRKISDTGNTIAGDILPFLQGENKACKFDYESALRLQALIKELFGYEVAVVDASKVKTSISKYEILVGDVIERQSCFRMTQGLADDKYVCALNTAVTNLPNHYIVSGGSYGATWHAVDALEAYLKEELQKNPEAVIDIKNAGDLSGAYEFKTVACIGDSITRGSQAFPQANGYGNSNGYAARWGDSATAHYFENYFGYPCVLQRELWKDHLVYNFGVGATTMRKHDGDEARYYAAQSKFANLLSLSNRNDFDFDVVLIMLGTNDSGKPTTVRTVEYDASYQITNVAWDEATVADYQREAKSLMDRILVGSPNAQFVLMNAPHRCDGDKSSLGEAVKDSFGNVVFDQATGLPMFQVSSLAKDNATRAAQLRVATALKAQGYNLLHYDMGAYTKTALSNGACGSDRTGELKAHEMYYNIKTDTGTPDTTHPNYRGYGKIALGMSELLNYLLHDGNKPIYMIDI